MFKTPPLHVIRDVEDPSVFLLNDKKETPFFSHFEEKNGVFISKMVVSFWINQNDDLNQSASQY
jgi:hypothetical protein